MKAMWSLWDHCRTASHGFLRQALLLLLLPLAPGVAAEPYSILIVESGTETVYQQVVASLREAISLTCRELANSCTAPRLVEKRLDDESLKSAPPADRARWDLVISIGLKAAKYVASRHYQAAVLHTLIPRTAAAELDLRPDTYDRHSAIFIDQPIERSLGLIGFIKPARRRLGVLLGPSTLDLRPEVTAAAGRLDIALEVETASATRDVGRAIRRILKKSDVLLALPDPLIYNRQTIINILLSSYHSRVPVIGFSAAYVKAGAIAAVYSSPGDIGRHIGDLVWRILNRSSRGLPPPEYPRYFHVTTNRQVAHSLGIDLPAAEVIRNRLESLEEQ